METRKALGKGLAALIPGDEQEKNILRCPVEDIKPSRLQPRKVFDSQKLEELAKSIKEKGVIQPLLVRRLPDGYELIAGERRWRAALKAGMKEVPINIVEATDRESLELALVENLQREDLNPIEEAEAYKRLIDEFAYSQEGVAERVGKDRTTVNNALRLLKLPAKVKNELAKGNISAGHARALLSLEETSAQIEVCRRIIKKGLSVREAEGFVKRLKQGKVIEKKASKPASLRALEDELKRLFGTKVEIKMRDKRGRIEIEFYSLEELDRILDILRP